MTLLLSFLIVLWVVWRLSSWQAGFNARVNINNGFYRCSSFRARDTAMDQDVSNTEGVPGNPQWVDTGSGNLGLASTLESRMVSLSHMEAEVRNPTFDWAANPFGIPSGVNTTFGGPAQVVVGQYINLTIFPSFAGDATAFWWSPSFLVLNASMDMEITRLEPVAFDGRSDGNYETPF